MASVCEGRYDAVSYENLVKLMLGYETSDKFAKMSYWSCESQLKTKTLRLTKSAM